MAQVELIMPKLGESVMEATILKWLKKPGDAIALDETILEIATDKVDTEVPSPVAGIISEILFPEGETVGIGKAIAIIATEGSAPVKSSPAVEEKPAAVVEAPVAQVVASNGQANDDVQASRFYSPLVKNIAKTEGIGMAELEGIKGSGQDGRVTKADMISYLENRGKQAVETAPAKVEAPQTAAPKSTPAPQAEIKGPVVDRGGNVEIIEMDRMRKLIADHMVMSKHVSPHVTSFVEADVTNLVRWRDKVKGQFEKRYNDKITFTPIFIEAVVKALKDYPMVNVSVDGTQIIKRLDINIGMATALPSGNLIVPVIKNADFMNLAGLAKSVNDLANRARDNKLKPEEIQGGTFTLTNVGSFGNVMGTPIINQPQAAILAVGAIRKKPAVLETPDGDVIAIRHMMFLSLSYDHRVVDGSLGGSFLRRVADYLEAFDQNRDI
jgi:2-oxoglutarate dehydrogenase E2 component (dihydrolipoamide succinyltransferase)